MKKKEKLGDVEGEMEEHTFRAIPFFSAMIGIFIIVTALDKLTGWQLVTLGIIGGGLIGWATQ